MRAFSKSPWLLVLLTVCLLVFSVAAQDNNNNNNNNNNQPNRPNTNNNNENNPPSPNTNTNNNNNNNNNNQDDNLPDANELTATQPTASPTSDNESSSDDNSSQTQTDDDDNRETSSNPRITAANPTNNAATTGNAPTITGNSRTGAAPGITGGALPSVAGVFEVVAPSVPPTANAPFMQESSLPEGTVFIIVGAILGFLGMGVLLWRAIVAWSLHRSVDQLDQKGGVSDNKLAPPAPFYSQYRDQDSTLSLSAMGNKKDKKGFKTPDVSAPSASSLFFSPTAAGAGMNTTGNRSSGYLPSGYYGGTVAGSQSHVSLNGPAINMSTLRPDPNRDSQRFSKATSWAPSPPDSPGLRHSAAMKSSSTLNLAAPSGDNRTPSVCLDDLLGGEGGILAPGAIGSSPLRDSDRRGSSNLGPNGGRRSSTGARSGTAGRSVDVARQGSSNVNANGRFL